MTRRNRGCKTAQSRFGMRFGRADFNWGGFRSGSGRLVLVTGDYSEVGRLWFSFLNAQMRGTPPHPRKSVLINVTFGDLLEACPSNAGGREERGAGNERAGARRGSLALRCPVASQPDGPGSGRNLWRAWWEESRRRKD